MLRFNSTTVQLILRFPICPFGCHKRFNSTTVQLILMEQQQQYNKELFQFHNGTINTQKQKRNLSKFKRFNSTTVQLILFAGVQLLISKICFNSTTVQLILNQQHNKDMFDYSFNSTTVQLIQCGKYRTKYCNYECFNSTTVQLIQKSTKI